MAKHNDKHRRSGRPFDDADTGFTLLPMLAGSLVLIAVGTVVVTTLV